MKRITYEPENMSQVMNSFMELQQMNFKTMDEYFEWRNELIPYFCEDGGEDRELLYNLSFITALVFGRQETRIMLKIVLQNILNKEFSKRIKEIEKARRNEE